MLVIGESINGSIKRVGEAIQKLDSSFLIQLACEQKKADADMLDINTGVVGDSEEAALPWLVRLLQAEVGMPMMIDSLNPRAIAAALEVYQGYAIINSLSGEQSRWEQLLPLVTKYHCGAVLLCVGEVGIPATAEERLALAQQLVGRALEAGIEPGDLYVDPLVPSLSADSQAGMVTLETLRLIRKNLPEVHTICGISNISYGLPHRHLLNATFLAMAVAAGLDTFLIDACNKTIMAALQAANALTGCDPYCSTYLKAYRAGLL